MRRGWAIILMLLAATLGSMGVASAAPETAMLTDFSGPVTVLNQAGQSLTAHTGQLLEHGQMIRTGAGARATLSLPGGSKVEIFEDSNVLLNELLDEEGGWSFSLFLGRLAMKLKHLVSEDLVVSPTMVCGVRGTEFDVGVAEDGTTIVSVSQGTVAVASAGEEALGPEVSVPANREVEVGEGGRPSPGPARERTDADWQNFRQQRLEALLPRLPSRVAGFEPKLARDLAHLMRLAGLIEEKSKAILDDAEKIRSLGAGRRAEQKVLLPDLVRNTGEVFVLTRFFRYRVTRLRTVMVRAMVLQEKLPELKDRLGADYPQVEADLAKVLDRREEIKAQVTGLVEQVHRALMPLRPVVEKLHQAKKASSLTNSRRVKGSK